MNVIEGLLRREAHTSKQSLHILFSMNTFLAANQLVARATGNFLPDPVPLDQFVILNADQGPHEIPHVASMEALAGGCSWLCLETSGFCIVRRSYCVVIVLLL